MNLDFNKLKSSLLRFYDEQLQCRRTAEGIHIAYPLLLPNGWQISFSIYENKTMVAYELSDNRLIYNYLENYFSRLPEISRAIIKQKCEFYGLELLEYGIFRKIITNEISPVEVQFFAEGLLAVSYLVYRYEKRGRMNNEPFETVREIFIQNSFPVETNIDLCGKHYKKIHADFKYGNSVLRVINNRDPLSSLQITAFQFNDYKLANADARRILIYNPDHDWDSSCQSLADSTDYFEFSSSYLEREKIHRYLNS